MSNSTRKAFTMIELLVVMAIIAILASMSIFALQGARESRRDATRKANLEAIRSALELYRADCGQYPTSLPSAGSPLTGSCPNTITYLDSMPGDPIAGNDYAYSPSGSPAYSYTLCAAIESSSTPVSGCGSCGASTCTYKVTNP